MIIYYCVYLLISNSNEALRRATTKFLGIKNDEDDSELP